MTRLETACYCLLASAFVLAGILLTNLSGSLTPRAHAEMVINRDNFTLMTARISGDAEAIFVLDNINEKLLVYNADLGHKQLDLANVLELSRAGAEPTRDRRSR